MRTFIIGDVHGCVDELRDLCNELNIHPTDDQVYFIGDLINKGPSSLEVIEYAASLKATSLLGNHEHRLLQQARGTAPETERFHELKKEFGSRFAGFIDDLENWPTFVRLPDAILVHAGIPPGQQPENVDDNTLVTLRSCDYQGNSDVPWFEPYRGPEHIVFGHWAALRGVKERWVTGLDTGCVYGGELSALILEEQKWVQVPARKAYEEIT